jgi:hypothetical protein
MATEDVQKQRQLAYLRKDFASATGTPFTDFYCPILLRDEPTELCLGHIVNDKIEDASSKRVLQRKDVDGFYGTMFETDFVTMFRARNAKPNEILANFELNRKMNARFFINGEVCEHYCQPKKAPISPNHTAVTLRDDDQSEVRVILKKSRSEVYGADGNFVVNPNFWLGSAVALIKAGFLTLFRLATYNYALSAHGIFVGHDILGKFFSENHSKGKIEVRAAGLDFFRPYLNMIRPINYASGEPFLGTVVDHRAKVAIGTSGQPYAVAVCIRGDDRLFAVLMPWFGGPDSVETYLSFLQGNRPSIRLADCVFDKKRGLWELQGPSAESHWGTCQRWGEEGERRY